VEHYKQEKTLADEAIVPHYHKSLAKHEHAKPVSLVEPLSKTHSGKIRKNVLWVLYRKGLSFKSLKMFMWGSHSCRIARPKDPSPE
jgi:acyl-coenzyme A synthetase/AMP-(fatty) acid ligase